ncbi:MAG: hypothetical protein AAGH78_01825 [Cyanobacteria bacterium P01_H01_bin.58]
MNSTDLSEMRKYRQLLVVLIILFLLSPFLKSGIGGIVSDLLLLYTIVLVIRSFTLPKSLLFIYVAIASFSFFMQLGINSGWAPPFNQAFMTNIEAIIGQLYPAVFISVLVGGYLTHRTYP